jgi:inosine/xanthosine triphosphate pyrophosphatase family protein/dephospho-CoA kinase
VSAPTRPTIRELFLSGDRRLEVFFYTSSLDKFLHASTVFDRSGLLLKQFKGTADPYKEDYSAGKERLLTRAIREIVGIIGREPLFFVEDTSLRIDALSEKDDDLPGLAVKEWFAGKTFAELDSQLRDLGRGRAATIKSDIALHVPGLPRPLFFHGSSSGRVAETPPAFAQNPQYPWLTPHSFNGWFIPDGGDKRLGEMDLEESWQYDFRTRALESLISRLEEYAAILNLPSHAYSRSRHVGPSEQLLLLPETRRILLVIGKTCAGKTTFGEIASGRHGLHWIEASSILRTFRSQYDEEQTSDFDFAKYVLEKLGPDAVARKILNLYANQLHEGAVITGVRTIQELEVMKAHAPQAQVVSVEASERIRYRRHLARGRLGSINSLDDFRAYDTNQWSFGLLRVAEDIADIRVVNEGTLQDYWQQIEFLVSSDGTKSFPGVFRRVHTSNALRENQIYRCLVELSNAGRSLSCDEIQTLTSRTGAAIRHNNANKVLKKVPELAKRYQPAGERVRYEITNAGRAYIRYQALCEPDGTRRL